ncbi:MULTISPECIES: glycoside hydrolase family 2 TIM barrel-domain containing protein [Pontibacter]|uniref:glycoside hydrolase family 2 TIM barrel-domain containing protein n=1 Tax=Pontibacter TaxID=323449 RepID=UPI002026EB71|nr:MULTISPECIES: glycoside hydrolase family 2 TIM barrel-domain containing protein [Pontibacter]
MYIAKGRTVEIVGSNGNYTLYRHGKPYFIKGAAGYEHFDKIKAYGGNSVRVWHAEDAGQILDEAHANGLTVTLGLWLGREREGFNYYDKESVAQQKEAIRKIVEKYKDHPALLMWGIGNELYAESSNIKVWNAVNDIAEMIHEIDSNHPTTTTVMNVPEKVVNLIAKRCPALDVLSINSFGAMHDLKGALARSDWKGPYIVSEFGARGYWEAFFTEWLAPIEQTSSEKAEYSRERYKLTVAADSGRCLGSYVFLWGSKHETTPTWFSLINDKGEETQLVKVMNELWTGKETKINQAPYVAYLTLNEKHAKDNVYLEPGRAAMAKVYAFDPEGKPLRLHWEVLPETEMKDGSADKEKTPVPVKGILGKPADHTITLTPQQEGAYRLYVYLYDGDGNVATANFPYFVKK